MKDEKFKKIIEWTPAFDRTNPDPKKNYGIGSVQIRFMLKGKKGVVQFLMGTGWYLPEVQERILRNSPSHVHSYAYGEYYSCSLEPHAWDIGYHSYEPMYKGQDSITDHCQYLENKRCYYDGSGVDAEKYYNILVSKGEKELWGALGKYYMDTFYNALREEILNQN